MKMRMIECRLKLAPTLNSASVLCDVFIEATAGELARLSYRQMHTV